MAVVFNKSDFAMLVFFGTLCIRPATKSKISARTLTQLTSLEKTYGFLFETRSFLPSPSSSLFPPRIGLFVEVIFYSAKIFQTRYAQTVENFLTPKAKITCSGLVCVYTRIVIKDSMEYVEGRFQIYF